MQITCICKETSLRCSLMPSSRSSSAASSPSHSALLRQRGLKDTLPRRAVLRVLSAVKKPLSVMEIFQRLQQEDHAIGLVTVYRVVDALVDVQLLHRHPGEGSVSFCTIPDVHGHHILLHCTSCERVEEVHDAQLCKREEFVAKSHGFRSEQHVSELLGSCSRCS